MNLAVLSRSPDAHFNRRLMEEAGFLGFRAEIINPLDCSLELDRFCHRGVPVDGIDLCFLRTPPFREDKDYFHLVTFFLEQKGVPVINPLSAVDISGNKFRTNLLLAKAGIPVLPSTAVRQVEHLEPAVAFAGGYPVFLKTIFGTRGIGVIFCPCRETLRAAAETMWAYHANVFVEKFARKTAGTTVRILVCGGRLMGAVKNIAGGGEGSTEVTPEVTPEVSPEVSGEVSSEVLKGDPCTSSSIDVIHDSGQQITESSAIISVNRTMLRSNFSRGGEVSCFDLNEELSSIALRSCETLGLQLAGVDVIEDDDGWKVLDINSAPGIKGFEAATGKNVAREILEILGKAVP